MTRPRSTPFTRKRFVIPSAAWLSDTLALHRRYGNRGVFLFRGEFYEETVGLVPGRKWVWTTAEYLAKKLRLTVLEEAA